ncbi:MAG: hypothetical protein AAF282_06195 [Cyanobacteria bacterium P01_A01_bin.15]
MFWARGVVWLIESEKRHLFQLSRSRFTIDDGEWTTPPKTETVIASHDLLDGVWAESTSNR